MPSPYVRRRQLAAEIRKLRESRGLTADGLASLMFYNRAKISRLENAQRRPDLAEIMNILTSSKSPAASTTGYSSSPARPPRRAGGTGTA